jgi:hypothetical protein
LNVWCGLLKDREIEPARERKDAAIAAVLVGVLRARQKTQNINLTFHM